MEENKTVSINIRSPMIHLAEQQGGHQAEQPIQELDNDQAEQPEKAKAGTEEIQHQQIARKTAKLNPIAARVMTKPANQSSVKTKLNRMDRRTRHPARLTAKLVYPART